MRRNTIELGHRSLLTDDSIGSAAIAKAVITTYNRKAWAQEAIESALAQTYSPMHVVIVDDASSDGTAEMIQNYARRFPERVTAITKPENKGVADSVRLGLRAGPEAEYVALLNDDDLWYPTLVEKSVALLRARPSVGLVYSECDVVDEDLEPSGQVFSDLLGRFRTGDFFDILRGNHVSASTLVITREIAERAADTLPDRLVVFDYYILMLAAGYRSIAGLDETLAVYRETTDGLHIAKARGWRDTTLARIALFQRNPALVSICGGRRAAMRELSLRTLDIAVAQLSAGNLREYLWHSARILKMRQLRVIVWLSIHTATVAWRRPWTERQAGAGSPG